MTRFFKRTHKEAALPPGTVRFAGEKKVEQVIISIIDYDDKTLTEKTSVPVEDCFQYQDASRVSWIDVTGLHDTDLLKNLGEHFGLHPLVLEDIINTHQRPKIEDFGDHLFIVVKMLFYNEEDKEISSEQISFILGDHFLLTFQERKGDVFDPVRERIRKAKGQIRKSGPDYLAYALIDAIVDNYFIILEKFGEHIEAMEEPLLEHPTPDVLESVHQIKREMILVRKSVYPLREVAASLERGDSKIIKKGTTVFLRDVYDHTIQVIDAIESFRDMASGMQDLYLSSVSNRMNEVMKVLTIIATIFVPLTFVAGIYGMNFEFMPELKWRWSYPIFWVVVVAIGGLMLGFFRKKKWL